MGIALPDLLRRDPLMTAVACATLLTVVATGVYVAGAVGGRSARTQAMAEVDCRRILRMIDDAFADRRMTVAETAAVEEASRAMRAAATPETAPAIARCVGLPATS